jgi:D-alanyl-D-alanine carboxypeptidase
MNKIAVIFIFICMLVHASAQENDLLNKEMRSTINQIVATTEIPGISVAIAGKDGLIWSGTAGYSKLEERHVVSQGHLFGIGDLSSSFIAATAIQLIEAGLLGPEIMINELLEGPYSGIENFNNVTVGQLINQTSTLYSYAYDNDWQRRARGIQLNPKYQWRKDEPLKYAINSKNITVGGPGSYYVYSKTNATLLGLIIEKITGGLLEEEIRTRLLIPENLNETFLDGYEIAPSGSLVGSYHHGTNEFISNIGINAKFNFVDDSQLIDTSNTSLSSEGAAGSIISTPRDLALFQMAIKQGKYFNKDALRFLPNNNKNGLQRHHSQILGFTTDMIILEKEELVIVSSVNLSTAGSGPSPIKNYLNEYMEKIILPVAKKYAK